IRAHPDPLAVGAPPLRDRAVAAGRQADPAGGWQPVVFDQVVADQCTWRAGFEGRGFDGAITQRDGPELRRCQHVPGFGHGQELMAIASSAEPNAAGRRHQAQLARMPNWKTWVRSHWT